MRKKVLNLELEIASGRCQDGTVVSAGDLDFFHEVRDLDIVLKNDSVAKFAHHSSLNRLNADHFGGIGEFVKDIVEGFGEVDVIIHADSKLVGRAFWCESVPLGDKPNGETNDYGSD